MTKLAIPTDGGQVAAHFGRCPEYTIVDVAEEEVTNKEVVDNPGHKPGYLPRYLNDLGVDCVLAGGMGRKAVDLFDKNNIEILTGVSGSIDNVIENYLADNLEAEGDICDGHDH